MASVTAFNSNNIQMANPMTLGAVIDFLEKLPPSAKAEVGFGKPNSWRGIYSCIAFAHDTHTTAGEMLKYAKSAVGATYHGYKGGEYYMTKKTECYINNYGQYDGEGEDSLTLDRLRGMFNCDETAAKKDEELKEQSEEVIRLRKIILEVHDDLKMRADMKRGTDKGLVDVGVSVWHRLHETVLSFEPDYVPNPL